MLCISSHTFARFACAAAWALSIVFAIEMDATFAQPPLPPPPTVTPGLSTPPLSNPLHPAPGPAPVNAFDASVRIKDITFVEGDRVNYLNGEGLVTGLSGTGGKAEQTRLMARNLFLRRGLALDNVDTKSMSAVFVSGKVPAYARKGEKILVTVSVADDASSLRGGNLSQTALRGLDDEIYAIAQGPVIGGGVAAQGDAASVQVNHPTVGVCEAIVEREIDCGRIVRNGRIRLVLRNKDYSTANEIANVLNRKYPSHARAMDSGTVDVFVPPDKLDNLPAFISSVGDLRVRPDQPAKVVINQRTGTIVLGHRVKISRVLFASANIVISTNEAPVVSQPAPLSNGDTTVLPRSSVDVFESGGTYNVWRDGVTVGDLANALNSLAVSPITLIDIFTSLRNQGALQAELIIE
ncbi:MAG: flagellar basal body P-ring protein FlgI [Planctomycetota bacterium]